MKMTIVAVLSVSIALAGCATASKDVAETDAAPTQYKSYGRDQPGSGTGRIQAGAAQQAGRFDTAAANAVCTNANFSSAIYEAIALDMTLTQVTQTIGCAAGSFPVRDPSYMIYTWRAGVAGAPSTSRISVCFDETGRYVRACLRWPLPPWTA